MGKWVLTGLFCCFLGAISGCSSIPLSTMIKFSSFDERDFLEITPAELRARVQLEQGFALSAKKSKLEIEIETVKGRQNYQFPLQEFALVVIPEEKGLFFTSKEISEYQLGLTTEAIDSFLALQQQIKTEIPKNYS